MPGAAGDIIWAVSQAGVSGADACDSRDASRDRRDFRQGGAVEHHSGGEGLSWTASRECARYPIHNRRCAALGPPSTLVRWLIDTPGVRLVEDGIVAIRVQIIRNIQA